MEPVIPISAAKNEGVDELRLCVTYNRNIRNIRCVRISDKSDHDGAVHRCIHAVMHRLRIMRRRLIFHRFAATKAIEEIPLILEKLKLDTNETEMLSISYSRWKTERQVDRSYCIADMRFGSLSVV